ncbi:Uncharacterized conserved protein, phosphatidylethanolamine-binding protein (PEBP) family [Lachnospiraceae bacterium NE2001]|nr:Uncharacterized conserved protein, phosphatidylethanolamine-binding protein (PEBP) family [Lachnospiraceae bacterium NE2001]
MTRVTPIRYDTKTKKKWKILLIISGSVILLYILVLLLESLILTKTDPLSSTSGLFVFYMILVCLMDISVVVFAISLLMLIDSSIYLSRLKKNHFELPEDKKLYDRDLTNLPRTDLVENVYARDSLIGGLLYLLAYLIFVAADIYYVAKWVALGEKDSIELFVMMMLAHLFFLIFAVFLFRQKDTTKYVDEVDAETSYNRKVRFSINKSIAILLITSVVSIFGIMMAHSMTEYIYKSRYGHYEKTIYDFKENATMTVSSADLQNGVWSDRITNTEKGENLSPELSFDKVEGADYYFIYMVDESANNWVHWVASDVREEELATGANVNQYKDNPEFKYVGPYPPVGSGEHTYTIFVYAMKGKPDKDMELKFDEESLSADYMYYDYLAISKSGDPDEYGNVIAYGYISGTYSR